MPLTVALDDLTLILFFEQANPSPNNENGLSIAFGCCGHVFHLDCIQRWLKTRSVCPLCNKVQYEDVLSNPSALKSTTAPVPI